MPSTEELLAYNESLIENFRSTGGQVEGYDSLLLLTTTGAKSGKSRTSPLVYSTDGDRLIVLAAFAGSPTNPNWFHNLIANPDVTVEVGGETYPMTATVAKGEERDRLFQQHADGAPVVLEYQAKTSRRIPVVILERQRS